MLLVIIWLAFTPPPIQAALSDAQAVTLARKTWGDAAYVVKARAFGDSNWTYQVGFRSPGCAQEVTIVGSGLNSWDAAFATVHPFPPLFSGTVTLMVQANSTTIALGALQSFSAFVTTFQFVMDQQPIGDKMSLTSPVLPWSMSTLWDSTLIPDGLHVLCGIWGDSSGNSALVHATMIVVKQGPPVGAAKIATAYSPAGAYASLH